MPGIVKAAVAFLEFLFFTGWAGSLVVVVISGVEDMHTIMEKDSGGPATAVGGDHHLK